ncbi:hypothetical protein [Pelomonas sp. KK5]|uniref:hypothetical protein n=1 Tax=Pelomonas sp. KK5 TaxID=1855730 RepID=UPI00097CBAA8|nr:hypothetical protein [Pelomonas sp. KK5]
MHLVAIAWIFVVLLAAAAEAISPQGSLLGAAITFIFYGLLPLSIVLYVMGARYRRRRRSEQPDGGDHAAPKALPPVREET